MIGLEEHVKLEYPELDGQDRRELIDKLAKEKVRNTVEFLVDATNSTGMDNIMQEGIMEGITRSHCYLQSEFWDAMFRVIKKYGDREQYDGRTAWAVKSCKKMAEALN